MTCQFCRHEFCWGCLAEYRNGQHADSFYMEWCPLKRNMNSYFVVLCITAITLKVSYSIYIIGLVMKSIGQFIVYLGMLKLYLASFLIHDVIY